MERNRVLFSLAVLTVALAVPSPRSTSILTQAATAEYSSGVRGAYVQLLELPDSYFSTLKQARGVTIWPPYPPAGGEEWVQIEPYVWHFLENVDDTRRNESWYTMGREGIQWRLDNLIDPKIKELEGKVAQDRSDTYSKGELEHYQGLRQRMISNRDKAGSYYDDPNPNLLPEQPEACNYASTNTYITSQMYGSGTGCATGSSADTWVELHFTRGGNSPEVLTQQGTTWASLGTSRAKIPSEYGCEVEAWSHAFWGPFWWDSQDSNQWSGDSDCQ